MLLLPRVAMSFSLSVLLAFRPVMHRSSPLIALCWVVLCLVASMRVAGRWLGARVRRLLWVVGPPLPTQLAAGGIRLCPAAVPRALRAAVRFADAMLLGAILVTTHFRLRLGSGGASVPRIPARNARAEALRACGVRPPLASVPWECVLSRWCRWLIVLRGRSLGPSSLRGVRSPSPSLAVLLAQTRASVIGLAWGASGTLWRRVGCAGVTHGPGHQRPFAVRCLAGRPPLLSVVGWSR